MVEHLQALAINAFYAGELDVGRRACERLLSMPLPPEAEMQARNNRLWYARRLDELVGVSFQRIDVEPAHEGWSLFNPTILAHDGGLLAIVRSSNYRIVDGRYEIPEADRGVIRTANLLARYNADLTLRDCRPIAGPEYQATDFAVDGLEDCRLRHTEKGIGVSATVRNVAPFDGRCRIATADLDIDAAAFSNLRVLSGISTQEHEKNWQPLVGRPGWIYSLSHAGHVVTVEPDPALAGGYQMLRRAPAPQIASQFRGGGQVVPYLGGWLAVIHEVAAVGDRRAYEHRFVWLDADLAIRRLSPPFAFREVREIEFAAGLAILDDRVIVSFGVRDAEAWLAEIAEDELDEVLYDITV